MVVSPVINVTTHEGKMTDIHSISTSVKLNEGCKKRAAIKGSICEHCYAESLCDLRPSLDKALIRNTGILTIRKLEEDEIPKFIDEPLGRFESFGDLNNELQLENYMTIVKANPETKFALYTKCYDLVDNYFARNPVPDNFVLVISSLMMNVQLNPERTMPESYAIFKPGQLKVFTVYSGDYLKVHPEIEINCGSKSCFGCRRCYNWTNGTTYVGEILKSQQTEVELMLAWRNPEFRAGIAEEIERILGTYREEVIT